MFYLYRNTDDKVCILEDYESTYCSLESEGYKLEGMHGRYDYAKHWADYKNGEITESEHRLWLGLRP